MGTNDNFDAIIVGAGPAGLAVASELCGKFNLLVLEKGTAGTSDRFWFVPPSVLDRKVKPFSYGGVTRFLTRTYSMQGDDLAWRAKLYKSYPYIDDARLLSHWVTTIRSAGSTILDGCTYLRHDTSTSGVTVTTSLGTFSGRLLIDASGFDSPIVKQYGIDRSDFYWWSVYGAVGEHPDGIGSMQVGDYMMWQTFADADPGSLAQGKPVFEYEILDEKRSFSLILYLKKNLVDLETMKKEYLRIISSEESTRDFRNLKVENFRYGWYPSGGLSQQIAEERVAFVGDAGCWTTPCGWGMTFILHFYRTFTKQLAPLLRKDRLDRESLLGIVTHSAHEKYQTMLNVVATHFLANASTSQLDRFIRLFKKVDPILCEKMFTLTMSQEELAEVLVVVLKEFSIEELGSIIPALGVRDLFEAIGYCAEDLLIDSFKALLGHHERCGFGG